MHAMQHPSFIANGVGSIEKIGLVFPKTGQAFLGSIWVKV